MPKGKITVAVVGSGLSGLQAAATLQSYGHQVSVFEACDRIGGHIETLRVPFVAQGSQHEAVVDMGVFMFDPVLIHPYLFSLIKQNNIALTPVPLNFTLEMHHGEAGRISWTTSGYEDGPFMAPRVLAHAIGNDVKYNGLAKSTAKIAQYFQCAFELERFNRMRKIIASDPSFKFLSIGDFLKKYNFSDLLLENLIMPQMLCWWGSPRHTVLQNGIQVFVDSVYKVSQYPQYTLTYGLDQIIKILSDNISNIRVSTPVRKIRRVDEKIVLHTHNEALDFDAVIIATPPTAASKILPHLGNEEQRVLANYENTTTTVYLHSDSAFMPRQERWAIINSIVDERGDFCTFWVGKLQPYAPHLFLSWGDFLSSEPDSKKTIKISHFLRTLPTVEYINSSEAIDSIQGKNRIWFCGAHVHALKNSQFTPHSLWADNALKSGLQAAEALQKWCSR